MLISGICDKKTVSRRVFIYTDRFITHNNGPVVYDTGERILNVYVYVTTDQQTEYCMNMVYINQSLPSCYTFPIQSCT
jgi:GH43 family beta-xylosidase